MWCINLGSSPSSYTGGGSTALEQLLACFDRHVDAVIDTRGESDILIEGKNGAIIPNFPDEIGEEPGKPRRKLTSPQRQLPDRGIPTPSRRHVSVPARNTDDDIYYH